MTPHHYKPLATEDKIEDNNDSTSFSHVLRARLLISIVILLLLSVLANVVLVAILISNVHVAEHCLTSLQRYSPAQDVIQQKEIKFTIGAGDDIPIYEQEPSPEVDEAWVKLYEFSIIVVNSEEMTLLPNFTEPLPENPQLGAISLDVFHQLHCLNMIRKIIQSEYYPDFQLPGIHIQHCIGAIRQALMCFADTTPVVWQFRPEFGQVVQRDDVLHTCSDFDIIKGWAGQRVYENGQRLPKYNRTKKH
ncbi:hypothetical protein BDQ17DRAFT_1434991 [Cyathus striatus]|nr:hypothetical protein BDQ17DRAFT_1434991 [Cyathus striatus]